MALIRVEQDAHVVVAQAVGVVFLEKELRVVDEELTHFLFPEGETEAAGVANVAEVQAVVVVAPRHAIEEIEALVAKVAAGVVMDDVEDDGQAVQVGEVDQAAELIGGALELAALRRLAFGASRALMPGSRAAISAGEHS